jgi:mono/diheme cytochrome c family protein
MRRAPSGSDVIAAFRFADGTGGVRIRQARRAATSPPRWGKAMRLSTALFLALCAAAPAPARAAGDAARGRYLAILGDCSGCHTVPHGAPFAGGLAFHAQFGTVHSTNITPDPATGIGRWTADQFHRALHDGIAAGGRHLYPAFPYVYFRRLSRRDTDDLYAYLRTVKPVRRAPTPNRLVFPFNIRALMVFWNWLYRHDAPPPDTARPAAWRRGEFLVNGIGHCAGCHTPKDILFGDINARALTGGLTQHWYSANLTGSRVDGLGKWSRDDVVTYLATGRNRFATAAGTMQEKVTSSTSRMRPQDRLAIATYLKSLPPRETGPRPKPDASRMAAGRAVFVEHCVICHEDGAIVGAGRPLPDYPRLGGDTLVAGQDPTTVIRIVLEGAASPVTPNGPVAYSMPAFAALSDGEIADVTSYIRASWGNDAPPVSRRAVAALRRAVGR